MDAPAEEFELDSDKGNEGAVQMKEAFVSVWMNVMVEKGRAVSKVGATV